MRHKKPGHPLVCPPWLCFTFDNRLRRHIHNTTAILGPYVGLGDSVLDIGPGMGYFSIPLARLVGPAGRVTAIDIQEEMLAALARRAGKNGVSGIVRIHLATPESLGDHPKADFVLAFWMVHEVPNQKSFLTQISNLMKPGGRFLLVEPKIHVTAKQFARTMAIAGEIGFVIKERPKVRLSHSVVLTRG
jgi:2-polyprenyl-3-methyl-5-hydroxy-6-metoxy-1,4-benzoquinol methylase